LCQFATATTFAIDQNVELLRKAKGRGSISMMKALLRMRFDLTAFLYQRVRDYCIGMISSRWLAKGANVCGAGGR